MKDVVKGGGRGGENASTTCLCEISVHTPTHPFITLTHTCGHCAHCATEPTPQSKMSKEATSAAETRALPAPERQWLSLSLSLPPSPSLSLKRLLPRSLRPRHLLPPGIIPFLNLSRRQRQAEATGHYAGACEPGLPGGVGREGC